MSMLGPSITIGSHDSRATVVLKLLVGSRHSTYNVRRGPQNREMYGAISNSLGKEIFSYISTYKLHRLPLAWLVLNTSCPPVQGVPYLRSQLGPSKCQSFQQVSSRSPRGVETESLRLWDSGAGWGLNPSSASFSCSFHAFPSAILQLGNVTHRIFYSIYHFSFPRDCQEFLLLKTL